MVDYLIPQGIRIKEKFDTTPRLVDDYETAAAIGLACRDAGRALPDEPVLSVLQKEFLEWDDVSPKLQALVRTREADDGRKDWRRILVCAYEYEGSQERRTESEV